MEQEDQHVSSQVVQQEVTYGEARVSNFSSSFQEEDSLNRRIKEWNKQRAGRNRREFACYITGVRVALFPFSHAAANDALKGLDFYTGTLRKRINMDDDESEQKRIRDRKRRMQNLDRLYYRESHRTSSKISQVTSTENLAESKLMSKEGEFNNKTSIHIGRNHLLVPCEGLDNYTDYLLRGTHVLAKIPRVDGSSSSNTGPKPRGDKLDVDPVYTQIRGKGSPKDWSYLTYGGVIYEYQNDGTYTVQTYYDGNLITNIPRRNLEKLYPEFQYAVQKTLQGFRRASLASLMKSVKIHPMHKDSYILAISQLFEIGRPYDAAHLGKRAVLFIPDSARLHYLLACALIKTFRYAEAIMNFRVALRLDPFDQETANALTGAEMRAKLRASNFDENVPELHQLYDADPGAMMLVKDVKRRYTRRNDELPSITGSSDGGGTQRRFASQNYALTTARMKFLSYLSESVRTVALFFCRDSYRTVHQNRIYCSNWSGSLLYDKPRHFGSKVFNIPDTLSTVTIGNSTYSLTKDFCVGKYHKIFLADLALPKSDASFKQFFDVCYEFAMYGEYGSALNPVSRKRSSIIKANLEIQQESPPEAKENTIRTEQPRFADRVLDLVGRHLQGPVPPEELIPKGEFSQTFAENLVPPHRCNEKKPNLLRRLLPSEMLAVKEIPTTSTQDSSYPTKNRRWSLGLDSPRKRTPAFQKSPRQRRKSLPDANSLDTADAPELQSLSLSGISDFGGVDSDTDDSYDEKQPSKAGASGDTTSPLKHRKINAFDFFHSRVDSFGPQHLSASSTTTMGDQTSGERKEELAKNHKSDGHSQPHVESSASTEGQRSLTGRFAEALMTVSVRSGEERSAARTSVALPRKTHTAISTSKGGTSTVVRTSTADSLDANHHEKNVGEVKYPSAKGGRVLKQAKSDNFLTRPQPPGAAATTKEQSNTNRGDSSLSLSQRRFKSFSRPRSGRSSPDSPEIAEERYDSRPTSSRLSSRASRKGKRVCMRVIQDEEIDSDAESTKNLHIATDNRIDTYGTVDHVSKPGSPQRREFKRTDRYIASKASLKKILQDGAAELPCRQNLMTTGTAVRTCMLRWMESGQYYREVCLTLKVARRYFRTKKSKENDIIVFDVDDTALTSFAYFTQTQLQRIPLASPDWFHLANSPPLYPVLEFYQFLLQRGYQIVFLSERPSYTVHHTKEALFRAGYDTFKHLIVRPDESNKRPGRVPLNAGEFKFESRRSLKNQGYRIVGTVGDQASDFAGGHTGFDVKIPNYCYIED